jgi:hypothetical protein
MIRRCFFTRFIKENLMRAQKKLPIPGSLIYFSACGGQLPVHAGQEFFIAFGATHPLKEFIHGFFRIHVGQINPQQIHPLKDIPFQQEIIPAGRGGREVDGGENPPVGQAAVQL